MSGAEKDYWYILDKYTEWGAWDRFAYVRTYKEALAIARYCQTLCGATVKLYHGDKDISKDLFDGCEEDKDLQEGNVIGIEAYKHRKRV